MSAVVEAVTSVVAPVVETVGSAVTAVVDTATHVVDQAAKVVEKSVDAAIADPIGTIAKVAAVATGNAELLPYITAGDVVAHGGSIEQAIVAGGTTAVVQGVANYVAADVSTANQYDTTPFSEQTRMLAEQNDGLVKFPLTSTGQVTSDAVKAQSEALASGATAEQITAANATSDPIAALNKATNWTGSDADYLKSIGAATTTTTPTAPPADSKQLYDSNTGQTVYQTPQGTTVDAGGKAVDVGGDRLTPVGPGSKIPTSELDYLRNTEFVKNNGMPDLNVIQQKLDQGYSMDQINKAIEGHPNGGWGGYNDGPTGVPGLSATTPASQLPPPAPPAPTPTPAPVEVGGPIEPSPIEAKPLPPLETVPAPTPEPQPVPEPVKPAPPPIEAPITSVGGPGGPPKMPVEAPVEAPVEPPANTIPVKLPDGTTGSFDLTTGQVTDNTGAPVEQATAPQAPAGPGQQVAALPPDAQKTITDATNSYLKGQSTWEQASSQINGTIQQQIDNGYLKPAGGGVYVDPTGVQYAFNNQTGMWDTAPAISDTVGTGITPEAPVVPENPTVDLTQIPAPTPLPTPVQTAPAPVAPPVETIPTPVVNPTPVEIPPAPVAPAPVEQPPVVAPPIEQAPVAPAPVVTPPIEQVPVEQTPVVTPTPAPVAPVVGETISDAILNPPGSAQQPGQQPGEAPITSVGGAGGPPQVPVETPTEPIIPGPVEQPPVVTPPTPEPVVPAPEPVQPPVVNPPVVTPPQPPVNTLPEWAQHAPAPQYMGPGIGEGAYKPPLLTQEYTGPGIGEGAYTDANGNPVDINAWNPADIATAIASGLIVQKILTPNPVQGYGPIAPTKWGAATPIQNPGLNPGYLLGAIKPAYQGTATQSYYNWGQHPYVSDLAHIQDVNAIPSGPAWGAQYAQGVGPNRFDVNAFTQQILGPQAQQAATGTSPVYPLAPGPTKG